MLLYNVTKLFSAVSYDFFNKARAFVPGKALRPSLMFVGKAGVYPNEALFTRSTLGKASGLTHKHKTRLRTLAMVKWSSLLRKVIPLVVKMDLTNSLFYELLYLSSSLLTKEKSLNVANSSEPRS